MIYPVKDSHSTLGTYNHRDHSWSNEQHANSNEVQWVDVTKKLHADTLEHMDLIDGRTGVPSAPADGATGGGAGVATPGGGGGVATPALF